MLHPVWQQAKRPTTFRRSVSKSFAQAGSYASKTICLFSGPPMRSTSGTVSIIAPCQRFPLQGSGGPKVGRLGGYRSVAASLLPREGREVFNTIGV